MFSLYVIALYMLLVCVRPTRKTALALTPWLIFACTYDWMRLLPNYEVNPIDVEGLYRAEKDLFGIASGADVLTPSEYFNIHHHPIADIMAGLFYLCWVPLPLAFGLYLYLSGKRRAYIHFSLAFLLVNLIGFCGYYIHPAAPPWYVMNYGFDPVLNTPGNVAGLGRFDEFTGIPVFHALYGKNANVFAAVPSLHAAYMLVTTIYAIKSAQPKATICIFAFICLGIWWTAVYSGHHYIIDVLLGIATTFLGIILLEGCIAGIPAVERAVERYRCLITHVKK
ncbi:MAG: phosphatase PAP2 family protein [Prevotella sp.]